MVTHSAELLGALPPSSDLPKAELDALNTVTTDYSLWATTDKLKMAITKVSKGGLMPLRQTYYQSDDALVWVQQNSDVAEEVATISKKGSINGVSLATMHAPFAEFSFLETPIESVGKMAAVSLLTLPKILDPSSWENAKQHLKSVEFLPDGTLKAIFGYSTHSAEARFSLVDGQSFYPVMVSHVNLQGNLIRRIEVSNFVSNPGDTTRPTVTKIETFLATSKGSMPLATWTIKSSGLKENSVSPGFDVEFDPASVQTIFDVENNVWIDVPK